MNAIKSIKAIKAMLLPLLILAAVVLCSAKTMDGTGEFVKIGLRYGSSAQTSYTVASAKGFVLGTFDAFGFHDGQQLSGRTSISVSVSGGRVVLTADGERISDDFGGARCIMPIGYNEGALVQYEGASYRGGLAFTVNSNNTINIIECLNMEDYLYGVIAAEMGRSNPLEALKAQAVASRSFTTHKLGTHKESGFDLCATVHCQSYKAKAGEHAETSKAVDETRGQVINSGGEPVGGYYFKNSGGHTQNSEDVWNDRMEYLRGVSDEFSPTYAWTWKATFQDIRTGILNSGAGDPGDISRVEISKRDGTGHVGELRAVGHQGVVTLSNERIRTALGASNVKSLMFSFSSGGGLAGASGMAGANSGSGGVSGTAAGAYATNGASNAKLQGKVYVLSGDGKTVGMDVSGLNVHGRGSVGAVAVGSGTNAAQSVGGFESVDSNPVEFVGRGYGHGVGMPQDSAIEMAKQGFGYMEILKKYYSGIDIITLY